MAHGVGPWIVVVLGGAIGGLLYWSVAGGVLGVGGSTPAECVAAGVVSGLAWRAIRRSRHKP